MIFKARSKGGGKNFLRLKDGEHVVGVFRGSPHTFYQHWEQNRGVLCTRNQGGCDLCKEDKKASFRFRVNLVMMEEGKFVAKIFEGGAKVYDALTGLNSECDLATHKVKISRAGTGPQDTVYTILPIMKDGVVTKEVLKQIEAVQLNALESESAEEGDAA
jgi:hypothetical protein